MAKVPGARAGPDDRLGALHPATEQQKPERRDFAEQLLRLERKARALPGQSASDIGAGGDQCGRD